VVFRETSYGAAHDAAGRHLDGADRMMALHDTFAMAFMVLALLTVGLVMAYMFRRPTGRHAKLA